MEVPHKEHGAPAALHDPLTVRVIEDVAAWDAIRDDWNHLHAVSPTASTTLEFVWLRSWWQVYAPVYGAGGLRIVTLWRGARLTGALPLYIELRRSGPFVVRCLRLISTGEAEYEETCPDYLNLLHLPGEQVDCVRAVWEAVAGMQWHTLEWLDLPDDSPLLDGYDALSRQTRVTVAARGGCPVAVIGGGINAYLAGLSSKTRMRARQELRKAEASGAVFELANGMNADEYMDDPIRVHQQRWIAEGRAGCFSAPRFTEFHRHLVHAWVASGKAVLARLSHRGKACVVLYGFVTAGKFDLYQLGVTSMEGSTVHSPGVVANLLLIGRLAGMGVSRYDFLRGTSAFKTSLTTEQRNLVCVQAARRSLLVRFDRGVQLMRRIVRKLGRMVFRRGAPRTRS